MALDTDRIDDTVLALLYLTLHDQYRAWKGFDWDALSRLHEKGMIENPVGTAKSVEFTDGRITTLKGTVRGDVYQAPHRASIATGICAELQVSKHKS